MKIGKKSAENQILEKFLKIDKHSAPNKDVLGGKSLKNNKNVLDFY